jgi:hypothetical protein
LSMSQQLSPSWRLLAPQGNKHGKIQVFEWNCSCHIRIAPDTWKLLSVTVHFTWWSFGSCLRMLCRCTGLKLQ